jgi:hypothetical protein
VNINYQKRFLKELAKIPSKRREQIEQFVFKEVPGMDSVFDFSHNTPQNTFSSKKPLVFNL